MKHIFILIALSFITFMVKGQTVYYKYDDSGNRIKRSNTNLRSTVETSETTAISETDFNEEIRIYPNPVRDILEIEINPTSDNEKVQISISDMSGKLITTRESVSGNIRFDMSPCPPGIYLMRMVYKNETIHRKIIKE